MAKGLIVEWIEKWFGTSWKSSLYGFAVLVVMTISAIYPEFFDINGIDTGILLEGILVFLGFKSARDNNVNDEMANVPHDTPSAL